MFHIHRISSEWQNFFRVFHVFESNLKSKYYTFLILASGLSQSNLPLKEKIFFSINEKYKIKINQEYYLEQKFTKHINFIQFYTNRKLNINKIQKHSIHITSIKDFQLMTLLNKSQIQLKLKKKKNCKQIDSLYQNGKKDYKPYDIWLHHFKKSNQNTYLLQRPINTPNQWIQKGDLIGDCSASNYGELALGKNLLVAYMPWEGFNFEDAVLINEKIISQYTSLHIEKYDLDISEKVYEITKNIPGILQKELQKLDKNGIIKIGSWVQTGDILVGKVIPIEPNALLTHEKLLYDIVGQKIAKIQEKCLRVPQGTSGRIIRISYIFHTNNYLDSAKTKNSIFLENNVLKDDNSHITPLLLKSLKKIIIYIMEKREFKVGDKISGRHGNKGIISTILPNYDMPYLPNGLTLDVLLNPLGVPSRMNVGQILECLLGFAGKIFQTKFQIICFDEIYGYEASRSFIYSKLLEACKKTHQKWLFSKKTPGKIQIFDGRNGHLFHQPVLVGSTYLMKLIHIVDEKIHARATGPYSLITQQPLRGRAKHGGQRFGEMEVWALQGFGSAYTLQELLTVKSDDLHGRKQILQTLLQNTALRFGTPESFRVVLRELQSLCLDLNI